MTDRLCQEVVEFFRSTPVYDRLLCAIKQRYLQLGRIGGTVLLRNLSQQDRHDLAAFFGMSCLREEQVKIAVRDFLKAFQVGRFHAVSFTELLEAYFAEPLITRAEQVERLQTDWEQFFAALAAEYPHEFCQQWLAELANRQGNGYRLIWKKFHEERNLSPAEAGSEEIKPEYKAHGMLREEIGSVCAALTRLPLHAGKLVRLPIFASTITTDPHGFDVWTDRGKLFQSALASVFQERLPMSGEKLTLLYQKAGILKGDISSYVTTYGLLAYCSGTPHPLWRGGLEADEVLQVTLENLFAVDRVTAFGGRVYVLENPAVFSELVESAEQGNHSLICTSGQLSLASWVLLDGLVKEGTQIFYSGDFDPEGLGIAQRLIERYPDHLSFWHYGIVDYRQALSEVGISENRLRKLGKIAHEQLVPVRDEMLQLQKAGYQELLLQAMIEDLRDRR